MAVADNDRVLFLLSGASGAGKSTFARAVADRVEQLEA
jgi:adenylate kinase family enzyme